MTSVLQDNPGLIVALALCIGPPIILCVIGLILGKAAMRTLWLIASLVGPIALIFLIGQLTLAQKPDPGVPTAVPKLDISILLGRDVIPQSIRSAKAAFSGILDQANVAQAAVTRSGQTALLAKFGSEADARTAAAAYHRTFGLHNISGDETNGWRAKRRLQQDYVEMLVANIYLIIWTGSTASDAAQCRQASHIPTGLTTPRVPLIPELQPLRDFFAPIGSKILGMVLLLGIYTAWFFKGVQLARSIMPSSN